MSTVERLDSDKRKAIKQLVNLGFQVEQRHGDHVVTSPEGLPIGKFRLAGHHSKATPERLQARYREWALRRGRFAEPEAGIEPAHSRLRGERSTD